MSEEKLETVKKFLVSLSYFPGKSGTWKIPVIGNFEITGKYEAVKLLKCREDVVFLDLPSSGCDKTLSLFCFKCEFSPCAFHGGEV